MALLQTPDTANLLIRQ